MVKKGYSISVKAPDKFSTVEGKDIAHVRVFMKMFKDVSISVGRKEK